MHFPKSGFPFQITLVCVKQIKTNSTKKVDANIYTKNERTAAVMHVILALRRWRQEDQSSSSGSS